MTNETEITIESAEKSKSPETSGEQLGWEIAATDEGLRIERIVTNSPIARAHLEEEDVIVRVGGENINTAERLQAIVHDRLAADEKELEIVVLRDGKELSYLLPLDSIDSKDVQTSVTRSSSTSSEGDLVEMIRQLQMQNQQQQEMLQTVLLELQDLRLQISGTPRRPASTPAPGALPPTTGNP